MTRQNNGRSALALWLFVLVIVGLFGLYYWASPYITLIRAGQAIDAGDADAVCERINFEALRDNLDEGDLRVESMMLRGLLELGIQCETVESALGIARMVDGVESSDDLSDNISEGASYGFESPFRFAMLLDQPGGNGVRLVLSRTLVGWELTDVSFEDEG